MKKAILAMLATVAVMAVQADYLYWMTEGYTKTELEEGSYAQLYYTTDKTTSGQTFDAWRQTYWQDDVVNYITGESDLSLLPEGLNPDDTFFYVEIYGDQSGKNKLYSGLDYNHVASYSELSDSIRAMDSLQTVSRWDAATIPEPTSGLLVLVGMVLLGLRRKKSPADLADDAD